MKKHCWNSRLEVEDDKILFQSLICENMGDYSVLKILKGKGSNALGGLELGKKMN